MHLHSIEVALQGGPVPPRFISIKWGGTSAPPEFTGGYIDIRIYIYILYIYTHKHTLHGGWSLLLGLSRSFLAYDLAINECCSRRCCGALCAEEAENSGVVMCCGWTKSRSPVEMFSKVLVNLWDIYIYLSYQRVQSDLSINIHYPCYQRIRKECFWSMSTMESKLHPRWGMLPTWNMLVKPNQHGSYTSDPCPKTHGPAGFLLMKKTTPQRPKTQSNWPPRRVARAAEETKKKARTPWLQSDDGTPSRELEDPKNLHIWASQKISGWSEFSWWSWTLKQLTNFFIFMTDREALNFGKIPLIHSLKNSWPQTDNFVCRSYEKNKGILLDLCTKNQLHTCRHEASPRQDLGLLLGWGRSITKSIYQGKVHESAAWLKNPVIW